MGGWVGGDFNPNLKAEKQRNLEEKASGVYACWKRGMALLF